MPNPSVTAADSPVTLRTMLALAGLFVGVNVMISAYTLSELSALRGIVFQKSENTVSLTRSNIDALRLDFGGETRQLRTKGRDLAERTAKIEAQIREALSLGKRYQEASERNIQGVHDQLWAAIRERQRIAPDHDHKFRRPGY